MDPIQTGQKAGELLAAGPGGIITVLCMVIAGFLGVIGFLYRGLGVKDQKIELLNARLVETTGRIEAAMASTKSAIEGFARAVEAVSGGGEEIVEVLRSIEVKVLSTAQLVAGNGNTITRIENDLITRLVGPRGGRS